MNKWRKRVIAVIFNYYCKLGISANIELVKVTACRAAGVKYFNNITDKRLQSIYYAFLKKNKDLAFAEELTKEQIKRLTSMN